MLVLAMALALMMAQQPTGTQWSKIPLPTADDFPGRAMEQGVSGSARVRCTVADEGHLTGCVVLSENPPGFGFGRAAIRVAQRAQIDTTTYTSETVETTIAFRLG